MALEPTLQGKAPFKIPAAPGFDAHTSYKIYGDLKSGIPPLIALHGGPGSGHEYLIPFTQLWPRYGIPVVLYDQIGCGASTWLTEFDGNTEVFSEATFVAELNNLIDHLDLRTGGYYILGQSWGGMFGSAFATTRPRGLRRLILANTTANCSTYADSVKRLHRDFPPELQAAVDEANRTGNYNTDGVKAAGDLFLRRHFYRLPDYPPEEFKARLKHQTENPTVRINLYGKSNTLNNGAMKDWSVISRLPNIDVPTFVYNAEFDPAQDASVRPFFDLIPRVRWVTFQGGAHMCHLEGELREKVLKEVGNFLTVHVNE